MRHATAPLTGHVPGAARQPQHRGAVHGAAVQRGAGQVPGGPLCGGHLPQVPLRGVCARLLGEEGGVEGCLRAASLHGWLGVACSLPPRAAACDAAVAVTGCSRPVAAGGVGSRPGMLGLCPVGVWRHLDSMVCLQTAYAAASRSAWVVCLPAPCLPVMHPSLTLQAEAPRSPSRARHRPLAAAGRTRGPVRCLRRADEPHGAHQP
jgi:hypothetical protein